MPRKWRHVYVIYRVDEEAAIPIQDHFDGRTTIKSVFDPEKFSSEDMMKEIARLNKLN